MAGECSYSALDDDNIEIEKICVYTFYAFFKGLKESGKNRLYCNNTIFPQNFVLNSVIPTTEFY